MPHHALIAGQHRNPSMPLKRQNSGSRLYGGATDEARICAPADLVFSPLRNRLRRYFGHFGIRIVSKTSTALHREAICFEERYFAFMDLAYIGGQKRYAPDPEFPQRFDDCICRSKAS